MTDQEHAVVLITAGGPEEAGNIAARLLEARLAACVSTIPGVVSRYRWRGRLEEAGEVLLIAKTRAELIDQITAAVREVHSYEVPEVIALPVIGGSRDYLKWIDSGVGPDAEP
jgi:periplasmic divalent cation tolerance protein